MEDIEVSVSTEYFEDFGEICAYHNLNLKKTMDKIVEIALIDFIDHALANDIDNFTQGKV
jgi:hypothetical protein